MGVIKDPAIKLFGKTIPLLPRGGNRDEQDKDLGHKEVTLESKNNEQEQGPESGEKIEPPSSSTTDSESQNQENLPAKDLKSEESPKETNSSQEEKTTLKKPDKILPCPRCKSLDTKFCYFNNYNVNQPRHFCKNCQRYWTAGGTMRNVPVGAGRRKNKNSASHYHYRPQTVPVNHPLSKPNGTVLSFGTSDTPLCESMASVLNIAEKGIHRIDEKAIPFSCGVDSIDEQSTGSSTLAPSTSSEEPRIEKRGEGVPIPIPIPCFNGSPWPYPMNPIPAFSFPMYPPTAYWGCAVPGPWAIPSCLPPGAPSYSPRSSSSGSGPNSLNLGKHSREGDDDKQSKQERCLWIPKTLRIDNPDEAAKSSIWTIVGVKNAKADAASSGGGMFKAFQTKPETKIHRAEDSQVLHANPAALSRSLSFQESS